MTSQKHKGCRQDADSLYAESSWPLRSLGILESLKSLESVGILLCLSRTFVAVLLAALGHLLDALLGLRMRGEHLVDR